MPRPRHRPVRLFHRSPPAPPAPPPDPIAERRERGDAILRENSHIAWADIRTQFLWIVPDGDGPIPGQDGLIPPSSPPHPDEAAARAEGGRPRDGTD